MNRVIKFRAWNGDYFEYANFNFKTGCLGCNFSSYVEIDTPQQFTGLLDKNGVEIYEGDIVESDTHYPSEVLFNHGSFLFHDLFVFEINNIEQWEVIGNIYQNSELLENE